MKNVVCILLSTYNGREYIASQLNSILDQIGIDVKILVRDDGSNDGTPTILQEYVAANPGKIFFVQGENVGFAMSFTHLLQMGYERFPDCSYFSFADQDDVWLPEKLKVAVDILKKEPQNIPVAYCSNLTLVDAGLNYIREAWNKEEVRITKPRALVQSFATGCTMVFNRKAVEMYITHLPRVIKVHDFLMYQMCVFLGKVIWDEHSYILYRQHGDNQIGKPGYWGRWKKRLEGHYKEHTLEYQNRNFLEAFKNVLSSTDIKLVNYFVNYRYNLFSRLSLLLNRRISYDNIEADFFYRLKVLKGIV